MFQDLKESRCLGNQQVYIYSFHLLLAKQVKHLSTVQETRVRALGWEDPLEKEMATHSSTITWKIPWTEEPGRLQSIGSQRVGHDLATSLSLSPYTRHCSEPCCCSVAKLCPILLLGPMDYSLAISYVHEIFQAIVLESVVISFSRGSPRPRD